MIPVGLMRGYNEALPLLRKIPGLNGIEIGFTSAVSEVENQYTLRFRVSNELLVNAEFLNYAQISGAEVVPGEFKLAFNTLNTAVLNPARVARSNPIQPGISVGCFECGTLGMMARDSVTGLIGFLTCYHVIGGWSGVAVTQPGPGTDRGNFATDVVGNLQKFIPFGLNLDAAFVLLNGLRQWDNHQFGTNVELRSVGNLSVGDYLTKSGRTTDITSGQVIARGAYALNYPNYGSQVINGFAIEGSAGARISDVGDSGAVWYDNAGVAKGLHFATDNVTRQALACNLPDIFYLLKINPI